jgi:hypothetical protein
MKKILTLSIMACFLSCDTESSYTKCIETTFNFNDEAKNKVVSVDTIEGNFTIKTASEVSIIGFDKEVVLDAKNGYLPKQERKGDTLIIQYFPTEYTPSNVLKFGTQYKFYK